MAKINLEILKNDYIGNHLTFHIGRKVPNGIYENFLIDEKKTYVVVATVIKKDNRYFCAQRKDSGELAKKWEFPGGKVESNESHEKAVVREMKEELDTTVKVNRFLKTINHKYNAFDIILHAFECEVIERKLMLSEHLDSKWTTIEEMEKWILQLQIFQY